MIAAIQGKPIPAIHAKQDSYKIHIIITKHILQKPTRLSKVATIGLEW
jgi:hypothetical protein